MKDNEIIKALECCSIPTLMSRKCEDCPMKVEGALCFSRLAHDTIHLIKRQQAEIEILISRVSVLAEIEKDYALKYGDDHDVSIVKKQIQAEAIIEYEEKLHPYKLHYGNLRMEIAREFADRLKKQLQWDVEYENKIVFDYDIDNLLKEMEKECEGN